MWRGLVMLIFMAAALACGHVPVSCPTRLGVTLVGTTDNWNCSDFERRVALALQALSASSDPRLSLPVGNPNWQLFIRPGDSFIVNGKEVIGMTYCNSHQIELADRVWKRAALTHELAHVLQGCLPRSPYEGAPDLSHANWDRDGIWQALEVAREQTP